MGADKLSSEGPPATWAAHAAHGADPESLVALATADPTSLPGPDLVDAIVASEKALSLLAGLQMRLMTAFAAPFVAGDPMRLASRIARKNCITGDDSPDQVQLFVPEAAACLAAAEIAAALRISPVTAGIRVREAATMTTDLAPTLHALEEGRIDRGKARVITEHCQPLTPEHTEAVQQIVLHDADRLSTSELRDLTGQAVITVDPDGAEERHRAAAARRDLTLRAQPDAMATLSAFLPADGAVKIFQISDLLATGTAGTPGDPRGIGARRVDALVDIADQLLTHGHLDLTDYLDHAPPDSTAHSPAHSPVHSTTHSTTHSPAPGTDTHREPSDSDDSFRPDDDSAGDDSAGDDSAGDDSAGDDSAGGASHDEPPSDTAGQTPFRPGDTDTDTQQDSPPSATCPPSATPAPTADRSRRALTRQGRRPHLSVTIGLGTLAGLDELPGKLAGFGAIPAGLARAIATSAGTITALITDPSTGTVTDAGALTYRPTQRLRDQVAALLNTCQFPSCRQPVWRCDIDHRDPFDHQNPEQGGRTDAENTGPFCRRHHLVKHHTDWRIRVSPERFTLHWTSPTGHHYSTKPQPPLLPDLRVTTAGTTLAQRLDLITTIAAAPTNSNSSTDDLLTALLLRHQLNKPPMEYDHLESAWDKTAADHPNTDNTDIQASDPADEPPF